MIARKPWIWLTFLALINAASSTVTEPRTGLVFDDKVQGLKLESLGLRTKGPFKVYAVGQYGKTNPNKNNNAFVLKMNMSVNAEKLSSALMDALKPRCQKLKCDANQVNEFKDMVLQALPSEGAKSGYTLIFNTSGNKVTLTVNGKQKGKIAGKAVAKAFAAIYTDKDAVCNMQPITEPVERPPVGKIIATIAIILTLIVSNHFKPNVSGKFNVADLHVYPIKSCAEQTVDSAIVTPRGFKGDRIAMIVNENGVCCTGRDTDKVKLFHVHPEISFPECDTMKLSFKGQSSSLEVNLDKPKSRIMECEHNEAPNKVLLADLGNASATWMEKTTGIKGCRLMSIHDDVNDTDKYERVCAVNSAQLEEIPVDDGKAPVSLADEAPFLLTNRASLEDLNRRLVARGHAPVDMRRFRPNLVVSDDSESGRPLKPWVEDTWKKIRIGNVEFFVWQRCGRCIMTTLDRDSLTRAPKGEPLSTLSTFREAARGQRNFGIHLIPDPASLKDGDELVRTIRVGDPIEVLEYDEDRLNEWEASYDDASSENED
jgi:uncharacterized protein YcbX